MTITARISILIIMSGIVTLHGKSDHGKIEQTTSLSNTASREAPSASYTYSQEEHLTLYAQKKYRVLLTKLSHQLSESELIRLRSILVARELVVNKRQRPAGKDYLITSRRKFDLQIRTELGDDVADAVAVYLRHTHIRAFLGQVNIVLIYKGDPLSADQIDTLCRLLAAHPTSSPRGLKSTAEISAHLEERTKRDLTIIEEAKAHLSPTQVEALAEEMEMQFSYIKWGIAQAMSK